MSQCKYCGSSIVWMSEGRKKVPVGEDGMPHECAGFKNARDSYKKIDKTALDPDLIKQYEQGINNSKVYKKKK